MGNCTKCVHKPVCELWRNEECQDASNYSESADCDYYVVYGMTPEDAATIGRFREHIFSEWSYFRMAEIAQAERDGRLVVLPCKVGDTVYRVWKVDGRKTEITEHKMENIVQIAQWLHFFGKTVFVLRKEAEAFVAKEAMQK